MESEIRTDSFLLLLSSATLISLNGGPGGTAVVDIDTTTAGLFGEYLEVTTTLRGPGVLDGMPDSFTSMVVLDPVLPF